jgi:hypothetical protein
MLTTELENEVRKLRGKLEKTEKVFKEKTRQNDEQITNLEIQIEQGRPLSEKEKAEKAAAAVLEELRKKLFFEIQQARFHFGEAIKIVTDAQKTEGANFAMLEKWAMEEYEELAGFNEMFTELDEALNYCRPDKG